MQLLQIFQDAFSDGSMVGYIGAGSSVGAALGSIGTMVTQKFLNRKKDNVDIASVVNQQVRMLFDNGEFKDKIIKELQDWACYREHCPNRINGEDAKKETE